MDISLRLQKYLADNGIASRRKSEDLIIAGNVKVNGVTAKIGDKVDPKRDKVTVKGKLVVDTTKEEKVYYMLHKPRGFVTTMSDEMGRKCIADLIADIPTRVYPVGRLDRDSEGLLLLTNDGEIANSLTHPSSHVDKTYKVVVRGEISKDQVERMAEGIVIDGKKTLPAEVNIIEKGSDRTVLAFVIFEGRNRQIRKMCESLGIEVLRLKRTAISTLQLGTLPAGKWRELKANEIKIIFRNKK